MQDSHAAVSGQKELYVPDLYLAATTEHFPRGMVGRMSDAILKA